jgi:hypothetical protein
MMVVQVIVVVIAVTSVTEHLHHRALLLFCNAYVNPLIYELYYLFSWTGEEVEVPRHLIRVSWPDVCSRLSFQSTTVILPSLL